jgi:UDP-N-acetylglucosamine/UDP-N-acetylgalactosamine diphosphorylase
MEMEGKEMFGVGDFKDVYKQLVANPKVEIVAEKPDGHWMRYTGKAVFDTDPKYEAAGLEAIKQGKVAALLLAGGMGTRLGSDKPKGMYDSGLTKHVYIFQRLIENLLEVVEQTGGWPRLFVMTSEKNDADTRAFLKEHDYFGYREDRVTFFMQDMAPASDYDGKVYMESRS